MNKLNQLKKSIQEHLNVLNEIHSNENYLKNILKITERFIDCYKNKNKILFCGNGGSAADAQHLAAELSGRFKFDREPLYADALHCNSSYLTAVANDYGYQHIYSRLLKGMGQPGDCIVGLTTSGNSVNIIEAFKTAKTLGMNTVAFMGKNNGNIKEYSDYTIQIPSTETARIQEMHITIGHTICELIEQELFLTK